mmetsp:Transcript_4364/g.9878  ORF Transcript_4364/g.9878 Transcript_4364/m.9878 type:complete len:302 (+) Transcript_4364:6029-6934(+)
MEHPSSVKQYQLLFSCKEKKLNVTDLTQYHLSIHISDTYFKVCCVHIVTTQCLLIEAYTLVSACSDQRVHAIQQLYQDHPLLAASSWSAVTLCIDNQQYTLLPSVFMQAEKLTDYLSFTCLTGANMIKHCTHTPLNMTVAFVIEPYLFHWFQKVYKHTTLHTIHQASSLIQGMYTYLSDRSSHLCPQVFVFVTSNYLHITVMKRSQLLYYNRFRYTSNDALLRYILIVLRTLKLDTSLQEVILGGNITKNSPAYIKVRQYLYTPILTRVLPYLGSRKTVSKKLMHAHLDILSAHLCSKMCL